MRMKGERTNATSSVEVSEAALQMNMQFRVTDGDIPFVQTHVFER
jgi:hypothetical protein